MGIVQAGSGAANARHADRHRPVQARAVRRPTIASCSTPFDEHYAARPKNDGIVLKVVPDDTMRGLELRKGTVDLVVNDLAPDIVWQLRSEGRLRVDDGARHRLRLHRAEPARSDPVARRGAAGDRLRDRSRRDRQVPAARVRDARGRASCRRCRGRSSGRVRLPHDPGGGARGCSTPPVIPIRTATARGRGFG